MKNPLIFGFFFFLFNQYVYAEPSCESGKITSFNKDGRNYFFKTETTCKVDEYIDISRIDKILLEMFNSSGTVSNIQSDTRESSLTFRDKKFDTGHGTIQTTYLVKMKFEENDQFFLNLNSSKIKATSWAKTTKRVDIKIHYQNINGSLQMVAEQETYLKRPFIAPGFERAVRKSLSSEIHKLGEKYLNLVL